MKRTIKGTKIKKAEILDDSRISALLKKMTRTGFEPVTSCLSSKRSPTELTSHYE